MNIINYSIYHLYFNLSILEVSNLLIWKALPLLFTFFYFYITIILSDFVHVKLKVKIFREIRNNLSLSWWLYVDHSRVLNVRCPNWASTESTRTLESGHFFALCEGWRGLPFGQKVKSVEKSPRSVTSYQIPSERCRVFGKGNS